MSEPDFKLDLSLPIIPVKRIVFDLDGTICTQAEGCYEDVKPIQEMIDKINSLHDHGCYIHIFTARGMGTFLDDGAAADQFYREKTRRWLDENGVKYDRLQFGKPRADLYVDDRGMNALDFLNPRFGGS